MPATAVARGPTVWNRDTAARYTTQTTGHTADAPMPTSCISYAAPITAWQVAANPTRSSPEADDSAGPMEPAQPKSTTHTTPPNSFAAIPTHQIGWHHKGMCGRFAVTTDPAVLAEKIEAI